jgi:glycosyltransferase involved in cell wall biosynthesis
MDYANGFAEELRLLGHDVETHWCMTERRPNRALAWIRSLDTALQSEDVDIVVCHYSVFSYGAKGIPFLVVPLSRRLRGLSVPSVVVLHEYAYPWGQTGWRGAIWAITQRLGLIPMVRCASGIVVTAEQRAQWLKARFWLPRRPVLVAPVFSNVPNAHKPSPSSREGRRVGMFGYRASEADIMTAAMAVVRSEYPLAELVLIGAPGPATEIASVWRQAAETAGIAEALRFTGPLCAEDLGRAIDDCDVGVFNDGAGPSSRKTTLAAMLSAGVPIIAVDGPNTWRELVEEGAVRLVNATPAAVAESVIALMQDAANRAELSHRARAFYRKHQCRSKIVEEIAEFSQSLFGPPFSG